MESANNTECLSKVREFPELDNIQNFIKGAIALKDLHDNKKKERESPKGKKKQKAVADTIKTTDWISGSMIFFHSLPRIKVLTIDSKSVKELSMEPVKSSVIEKLDSCIRILEKEQEKHESKKTAKCIISLKDTLKNLK